MTAGKSRRLAASKKCFKRSAFEIGQALGSHQPNERSVLVPFVRVVRFTDVDPQKLEQVMSEIDESQGPPQGIKSTGLQILVDPDQRTSVVLQFFDSAEDMADSEQAFDSMDSSETPGTRASVDRTELKREIRM
jgi:hypothetical protein